VEFDFLPARFNVANIVSRWRERYHAGEEPTHAHAGEGPVTSPHEQTVAVGLADLAGRHFDRLPLRSLRDFFCARPPDSADLAGFRSMLLQEGRVERWETTERGLITEARLGPLAYAREATMDPTGTLRVDWRFSPPDAGVEGWFGTLLCLTLLARQAPDRSVVLIGMDGRERRGAPGDTLQSDDVARLVLEDRAFGFALDITPAPGARLAACPIETLQRSEDRLETTYQGTVFALCWALSPSGPPSPAPGLRLAFRRLT